VDAFGWEVVGSVAGVIAAAAAIIAVLPRMRGRETTTKADSTVYSYLIRTRDAPEWEWQVVDHFEMGSNGFIAVLDDKASTAVESRNIKLVRRSPAGRHWIKSSGASGWRSSASARFRYWIKTSRASGWQAVDHFEGAPDGIVAVLDDGANTMVQSADIVLLNYASTVPSESLQLLLSHLLRGAASWTMDGEVDGFVRYWARSDRERS
jgi:hypothetical protein